MSEAKLLLYVKQTCKRYGVLCYKFSSPARRGVPDLVLVGKLGHVIFMELKNPNGKGKLSALQKHEITLLENNNTEVYTVDSYTRADEIIETLAT